MRKIVAATVLAAVALSVPAFANNHHDTKPAAGKPAAEHKMDHKHDAHKSDVAAKPTPAKTEHKMDHKMEHKH